MIRFEINGKQVNLDSIKDAFLGAALQAVKNGIQEKVGALRDPDTGEAPVIIVRGNSLDNLTLHVSASDKLLSIVKERLGIGDVGEEAGGIEKHSKDYEKYIFVSYASEDSDVASIVTNAMRTNGADTFAYGHEGLPSGDIVSRINDALERCTDFIAICSERSLAKDWIKTEINAAIIQKHNRNVNILLILVNLESRDIPAIYQVYHFHKWSDDKDTLKSIVSTVYEITTKTDLGSRPAAITHHRQSSTLSPAANIIVKHIVEQSADGDSSDLQLSPDTIREITNLCDLDIQDAVDELEGQEYITRLSTLGCGKIGFHRILPTNTLFTDFDSLFMNWSPEDDALAIAKKMVVDDIEHYALSDISNDFSWPARRVNPAANFLISRKLVRVLSDYHSHPFTVPTISTESATRRFVKSRDL